METAGMSIYQSLPWLKQMMDYTDKVCGGVTEASGALRPVDPQGGYCFSVRELLLHIADSRWQCLVWLGGGAEEEARFNAERYLVKYGGTGEPWQFKAASVAEALARLQEVRGRLETLLAQPAAGLLGTTEALRTAHEAFIQRLRATGTDTAELEAAGPGNNINALVFLTGHEQAHRAQIQMILRTHGYEVFRVA